MEGIIEFKWPLLRFTHDGCQIEAHLFLDESSGRFRIDQITISNPDGLPGDVVRTLPYREMEAFINRRYNRPTEGLQQQVFPEKSPGVRLRVPKGNGKKPDDFYRRVAEAYEYLSNKTSSPAQEIATRNGVKPTTVHRWVKEARARGLLAPGQKG